MSGRFLKRGQNHEGDDDDDDDDNEEEEEEEEEEEDEHGHHHHHAGHNHGGDDFDDDEDDDDVSSELMGPPQVMAPYSELAVLLDKFLSRRADGWQWSFEVMHELKDWVLRATNDRERNAFEQPTALVFNRNQELADAAAELLKELLRKCEKDEAALHLMGEFVHVLDCLRSEAEVTFEIEEKLLGGMRDYNEPKVPILPEIWHTLDAQAAEIHTLIYDLLQKLMVPRLTSHFSVTQVYVIDGLRNLMTKFIINWTCRAARAPAEIDFKLPLQGFPFAPPNVTDLLSLAPDAQRVAIVFLESFAFCVERDMASVFNKNFDFNSGLEAFGRCFRPAVVALLDNKETDDSTKLFVLRLVDVYPPFMLVDDDLCLPTFSRLFRDSTDPCIVYQASSAIQGLVNFAFDTLQEMEAEVDLGEDNFPEFVDSMFASIAQMRLLSSSASPVDCTNAIVGVTGAVDIFLGLWVTSDRFDLQKASRYFFSRFESLVEDMHQLSKPHAVSFINPSLAQRTALSMTSEELFGPQKRAELPVGGSFTVGTYAFYERVQRLCILVLDAVVINSMVDQMGQVGEVHLRAVQVFSEVCNLLVDEDLFRILTHPKALVLFERHENCLMDRLVNGGHLDNGSLQNLKTIDFFARINQLRWRLCLEHFGTFDLLVNRFPTLSIEHTCDPRKWLQVLHTMQLRDDPTYWQVFLDETKSPTCSPGSLVRMNDLLATSCHTFCGVINFVIRVNSTDETRPVITKAIMEVAKLVQPPEITDPAVRKEVVALMSYTSLEQLVSFHPLKTMLESARLWNVAVSLAKRQFHRPHVSKGLVASASKTQGCARGHRGFAGLSQRNRGTAATAGLLSARFGGCFGVFCGLYDDRDHRRTVSSHEPGAGLLLRNSRNSDPACSEHHVGRERRSSDGRDAATSGVQHDVCGRELAQSLQR